MPRFDDLSDLGRKLHAYRGGAEAFLLVLAGQLSWLSMLGGFVIPVLAGNIVGGTALFALIAYAQVMEEI